MDPFGQHDWESPEYVERWVASGLAAADQRAADLHRVAVALPDAPARVLDIGTGWGPLAHEVLTVHEATTLVAHDFSAPMLAHARETLASFGERVRFWRADLTTEGWADGIGGPFDAVVSAHAIHNVRSHRVIAAVYATVRTLLAPGGWFLNLEIVDPPGPATAEGYGRLRQGSGGRSGHVPGRDLAAAGLVDHLRWLAEAGFAEIDCLWKDLRQALLLGVAPG